MHGVGLLPRERPLVHPADTGQGARSRRDSDPEEAASLTKPVEGQPSQEEFNHRANNDGKRGRPQPEADQWQNRAPHDDVHAHRAMPTNHVRVIQTVEAEERGVAAHPHGVDNLKELRAQRQGPAVAAHQEQKQSAAPAHDGDLEIIGVDQLPDTREEDNHCHQQVEKEVGSASQSDEPLEGGLLVQVPPHPPPRVRPTTGGAAATRAGAALQDAGA
mmetsp:Transcript_67694/g.218686  ORF Transcript_67694/g.218686 Transcript_67694/m.218686 type:complete len:217 (-) Transcript_67694:2-652(-)